MVLSFHGVFFGGVFLGEYDDPPDFSNEGSSMGRYATRYVFENTVVTR